MKKRDFVLILGFAVLAFALLGMGLLQRGHRSVPEVQPTESALPSGQPSEEPESVSSGASGTVEAAVAAYFEENPAESYLVLTTSKGIHSPLPLNEENEFRITQEDGSENVIHIGHNSFYMASSNCDNQNCVQQGEVTLENRDRRILFNMVICLPHNLSLELLSREEAEALLTRLYTQAAESEAPFGADGDAQ